MSWMGKCETYCKYSLYAALRFFYKNMERDCECDSETLDHEYTERIIEALDAHDRLDQRIKEIQELRRQYPIVSLFDDIYRQLFWVKEGREPTVEEMKVP